MSPHSCIAWRQLVLRSKVDERLAAEIHLAQNFSIGRVQRWQHGLDTPTDDAMCDLVAEISALAMLLEFGGPTFERAVFRAAAPRVVNDGIAENGIKPGHDCAAVAHTVAALQRTEVGALQDVLCERAILHATLHKS